MDAKPSLLYMRKWHGGSPAEGPYTLAMQGVMLTARHQDPGWGNE